MILAALASLVLNVTLLMPAIYMMQVFDRVFTSGSVETLAMLGIITLLFLALGYFLDTVRARALSWGGRSIDRLLAPAAIRSALEQAAAGPGRVDTDALRDIAQLRAFLSGPGVLSLFDAPWLPIYLLIIALMHPTLGLAAAIGALRSSLSACSPIVSPATMPSGRCAVRVPHRAWRRDWRAMPRPSSAWG